MSHKEIGKTICPHCGEETEVEIYSLINGTQDPDLRDALLDYRLFKKKCQHCGKEFPIHYNTLYLDVKHQMLIQLECDENHTQSSVEALKAFMETFEAQTGKPIFAGYKCRIVNDINHLLEKIRIFEAGLDDRTAEMVKYYCEANYKDCNPEGDFKYTLFSVVDDQFYVSFFDKDGAMGAMAVERETYEKMERDLFENNKEDLTKIQIVDRDWLMTYLSQIPDLTA